MVTSSDDYQEIVEKGANMTILFPESDTHDSSLIPALGRRRRSYSYYYAMPTCNKIGGCVL